MNTRKNILIAGADGALGKALRIHFEKENYYVWSLSRSAKSANEQQFCVDLLNEESYESFKIQLDEQKLNFHGVIQCAGILHNGENMPEKQLSEISAKWLQHSMNVNVLSHIKLAQALENHIEGKESFFWASLSAMVGSIGDNSLGGWYSYRMSKAALNMFIHNLSIEWKRKNRQACIVSIHPGTTDSAMSKPFKVRPDKLYSPELSAQRIYSVLTKITPEQNGQFLNWDGTSIVW
ncbi:putative cell-cell signaling protein, C-factor (CsgA) [Lentisphaera araneosa HTCC2155]|uniref:Putative cell-cell signaling protein, C-factor (CsgA) n=1 Tax=Lentisphaera araneosa HTCC2155 TaxID=313628 RepID=A6DIM4_9BACT|nr:SDR family NAD(P)-dependent oxidoreductase [Lentisphaera araneosa]EDM28310.1 putative cell-cell signaling protein, C-factor (CsgA) [Lentisphaera araneosa HTCC2155]